MPEPIPGYFTRFRQSLGDEAEAWARDNIAWAAVMVILPPAVVYVATGMAQEWRVLWFTIVAYAVIFLCYVLLHALITPLRLDRELRIRVEKAQTELESIKEGSPKLVCKGISFRDNPIVRRYMGLTGSPPVPGIQEEIVGVPTFYHMRLANEPTGAADRKVAKQVAARVQMFREQDGTPAAKDRLHRWEDAPEIQEAGKRADRLLPLDIPPSGVEYTLDIAMKYDGDDAFYTPNNETVIRGSPDWREKDFEFPSGTYIAEVHLRGENVKCDLRCRIVNKGKGEKLDITPLNAE